MAPVAPKTVTFKRCGLSLADEDVLDSGGDDVAESLDGVTDHLRRHAAEVGLAEETVSTELVAQIEYLLGDMRWAAGHQGPSPGGQARHGLAIDIEAPAAVGLGREVAVVVGEELFQGLLLGVPM